MGVVKPVAAGIGILVLLRAVVTVWQGATGLGTPSAAPPPTSPATTPATHSYTAADLAGTEFGTPAAPASPPTAWRLATTKSPIDDSLTVTLTADSTQLIDKTYAFMGQDHARLMLRCEEDTTSAFITMSDHLLGDISGNGRVVYRIDELTAVTADMRASSDALALGLWRGADAIPFIRALIGHQSLVVRTTPFIGNSITVTFPVSGTAEAIATLRTACHW